MKVILQTRELPRGRFQNTVWSLCSFQAIRRRSLNLVGVAGFFTEESGQRKALLAGSLLGDQHGGWQGGASWVLGLQTDNEQAPLGNVAALPVMPGPEQWEPLSSSHLSQALWLL